jgi:hypothetical protein
MCSLCHCGDFFTCAFKAKVLDRLAQPINSGSFIDSLAGFDQEGRCLRTRCYLVRFAYRCQFLIMLVGPVHIDTASPAIFGVVIIRGSALWTLYHGCLLSIQPIACGDLQTQPLYVRRRGLMGKATLPLYTLHKTMPQG